MHVLSCRHDLFVKGIKIYTCKYLSVVRCTHLLQSSSQVRTYGILRFSCIPIQQSGWVGGSNVCRDKSSNWNNIARWFINQNRKTLLSEQMCLNRENGRCFNGMSCWSEPVTHNTIPKQQATTSRQLSAWVLTSQTCRATVKAYCVDACFSSEEFPKKRESMSPVIAKCVVQLVKISGVNWKKVDII